MDYRISEYGSIAALKTPTPTTLALPGATPAGVREPYRDDPTGDKESLPMRDLSPTPGTRSKDLSEKNELYAPPRTRTKRKALICGIIAAVVIVLIIAIAVPVYIFVIKKSGHSSSGSTGGGTVGDTSTTTDGGNHISVVTTGGDGSIVTKDDGTTFVYNNTFGGYWVFDPVNPLNESARAQSYSPPLNQQWRWGVDKIYGQVALFSNVLLSLKRSQCQSRWMAQPRAIYFPCFV
jgi:hypothetical protein